MPLVIIDAIDTPELKEFRSVTDPELARSRGLFVAEGRKVVERLLAAGRFRFRSLLLNVAAADALAHLIDTCLPANVPVYLGAPAQLAEVAGFGVHRGCLALVERPAAIDAAAVIGMATTLVGIEGVANPANVGGIFRNVMAFGADGVLLSRDSADPLYRKAIRTSMGATLSVPFAQVDSLPSQVNALRHAGFIVLGLTPEPRARALPEFVMPRRRSRVALLLGSEGDGLSSALLDGADALIRIPMVAGADSVNVAVAAALALYEIRERSPR
jgi:tRNA G18 (ribose-2'-O)-methylase SpoU